MVVMWYVYIIYVDIRGYTWIYVDRHSYWHVDICSVMRKLQRMATNIAYSGHVGQAVYYSGYKSSLLKLLQLCTCGFAPQG